MPKTIRITIEVPDGATVSVTTADADDDQTWVATYWCDYLSANGRRLYEAAAEVELTQGPGFTLDQVADQMGDTSYATAQSIHRTTGRTAKRWWNDTGEEAPIQLVAVGYDWSDERAGMRTTYRLPEGVANEIATLD
jgi:hypothetical protein